MREECAAQDTIAPSKLYPLISEVKDFAKCAALAFLIAHHAARPGRETKQPRTNKLLSGVKPVLPGSLLRPSRYAPAATGPGSDRR